MQLPPSTTPSRCCYQHPFSPGTRDWASSLLVPRGGDATPGQESSPCTPGAAGVHYHLYWRQAHSSPGVHGNTRYATDTTPCRQPRLHTQSEEWAGAPVGLRFPSSQGSPSAAPAPVPRGLSGGLVPSHALGHWAELGDIGERGGLEPRVPLSCMAYSSLELGTAGLKFQPLWVPPGLGTFAPSD